MVRLLFPKVFTGDEMHVYLYSWTTKI